jgi:unsaturated rhamnogalacturonyl hydrolase
MESVALPAPFYANSWKGVSMRPVRLLFIIPLCLLTAASLISGGTPRPAAADALVWAEKMATSEMERRGDSLSFVKGTKGYWAYETGVFLKGLDALWVKTRNVNYYDYLKTTVDSFLEPDGTIRTYKLDDYSLDSINCGKLLLSLYESTKKEKYSKAAQLLIKQLEKQPRTHEGGFWHKKIYPYQVWLDGVYMSAPFLAQHCQIFNRPAGFDEVSNQIIWIESHTRDSRTGLLYHGWDESRAQEWADPSTGCSRSFWGRAMGWYAMALVDTLDFIPKNHRERKHIIEIFQRMSEALARYQDSRTGLWYQVVDQGERKGNYLEASSSSMFVYAFAKGVRKGYLGREYARAAKKGYEGLLHHLIVSEPDGKTSLTQICSVGGLGGSQKRNGTFEYYISEPIVTNDLKGVGAFILASVEIDRLPAK